ncbi:MAG: electron transfer flavoprotein subunit alpha/FixB family protein [Planctomycetota bacterium]|jgi:electron transfer flavoprotein alpha subunit
MAGCILAYGESRDGQLRRGAFEALRGAAVLAGGLSTSVVSVVIGDGIEGELGGLSGFGASKVVHVKTASAPYSAARWARTLAAVAKAEAASAVVISASVTGKELAALTAAGLDAGLIPDATGLSVEGETVRATRPMYAGKTLATVEATSLPVVVSLRPKAIAAGVADGSTAAADVEEGELAPETDEDAKLTAFEETGGGKVELTEADVIVSGGRGMKGPENYGLIEELASLLGAAVGASRSAVDAGWRPHSDQVGQTGKTVSPDLYVACGISGAIQHLAGMGSSKTIVAINKDPEAPIFKVADYGIVGDLFKVVPALTEEVKKIKA